MREVVNDLADGVVTDDEPAQGTDRRAELAPT